jgi:rhodanese-related sulfurtransferase
MLHLSIFATILLFLIQEPPIKKKLTQDTIEKTINPEFEELLKKTYPEGIPLVSVAEFKKLKRDNLHLLDTRGKEEYMISHLKNAREVGYYWFDMRDVYDISRDATVVLYCAVGNRSLRIAEKLIKAGYKNVFILYGGIFEWVNEGNPVYTHNDIQTSQVHGYTKEWSIWLEKGNIVL